MSTKIETVIRALPNGVRFIAHGECGMQTLWAVCSNLPKDESWKIRRLHDLKISTASRLRGVLSIEVLDAVSTTFV